MSLLICQPEGRSESLQGGHHTPEAITAAANCAFASSNVAARPVGADLTARVRQIVCPEPSNLGARHGQVLVDSADLEAVLVDAPIVRIRITGAASAAKGEGHD
jgi:hypothetical protein